MRPLPMKSGRERPSPAMPISSLDYFRLAIVGALSGDSFASARNIDDAREASIPAFVQVGANGVRVASSLRRTHAGRRVLITSGDEIRRLKSMAFDDLDFFIDTISPATLALVLNARYC